MFPTFEHPSDETAHRQLRQKILQQRVAALGIGPLVNIYLPVLKECKLDLNEPAKELSVTPQHILLTESIQYGADRAQVYVGRLKYPSSQLESTDSDVIVKFFQQSLLPLPPVAGAEYEDKWFPATEIAQIEARAYETLSRLQGDTIPKSYGFFLVSKDLC